MDKKQKIPTGTKVKYTGWGNDDMKHIVFTVVGWRGERLVLCQPPGSGEIFWFDFRSISLAGRW